VTRRTGQPNHASINHQHLFEVQHGPGEVYRLVGESDHKPLRHAFSGTVDAVAGIAQPENFFALLRDTGLDILTHPFADHHDFTIDDLPVMGTVLMTEKDAVKCRKFARPDWWALEWEARPGQEFISWLAEAIGRSSH
jgi:tetraacyldisaccharide 4'-kinase